MLDQIATTRAVLARIAQELSHHVQLMEARPDLHSFLVSGLLILHLDDLSIVLENIRQTITCEDALPQVVCLETVWIGRITSTVIPALVERQEPGGLTLQVSAEAYLVVVHGKVRHAAAELEELLAWIAVALVLLDGILNRLLFQTVLQLK